MFVWRQWPVTVCAVRSPPTAGATSATSAGGWLPEHIALATFAVQHNESSSSTNAADFFQTLAASTFKTPPHCSMLTTLTRNQLRTEEMEPRCHFVDTHIPASSPPWSDCCHPKLSVRRQQCHWSRTQPSVDVPHSVSDDLHRSYSHPASSGLSVFMPSSEVR